jgi:hypothetical protein
MVHQGFIKGSLRVTKLSLSVTEVMGGELRGPVFYLRGSSGVTRK